MSIKQRGCKCLHWYFIYSTEILILGKKHFINSVHYFVVSIVFSHAVSSKQDKWGSWCFCSSCLLEPDPDLSGMSWKTEQHDLRESCLCEKHSLVLDASTIFPQKFCFSVKIYFMQFCSQAACFHSSVLHVMHILTVIRLSEMKSFCLSQL